MTATRTFKACLSIEDSEVLDFQWPAGLQYSSLQPSHHGLISALTSDSVTVYFCTRQATDGVAENSSQALTKGQLLLDAHRVEACSIASLASDIYLTGMVGAAMKKKVSFVIAILEL